MRLHGLASTFKDWVLGVMLEMRVRLLRSKTVNTEVLFLLIKYRRVQNVVNHLIENSSPELSVNNRGYLLR